MDYKSIIESKYNRFNWQSLLHDIFRNKVEFFSIPASVNVNHDIAKKALYLGKITLTDGRCIAVYEVELAERVVIERNRSGIRNLLCSEWRGMGCAGAFMFCFRQNEAALRFSYVSEAWVFDDDDGTYKKESTDPRRFTYLLGEGHRSRTAIDQFKKLKDSDLTLKDLTKTISVEAVSDMFFIDYKRQYENIIEYVTGKRMEKVNGKWEERTKGEPCEAIMTDFSRFPNPEKAVRDYVKKLMGRLVFIQFLQKKGWMGCTSGDEWKDGDKEYVQNLFTQSEYKDTFVDDVLEPLFADINTKREGDLASNPNLGKGVKIPYLNGGLFEKDAFDETKFPLPGKYMKNMLDFFASYNFTIDENDPNDAEMGVDPEMLGRVFENLLEDNKDKGIYYTPKEIVTYMCRESLIAYLQTDVSDAPTLNALRQFVNTHDATCIGGAENPLAKQVNEALMSVKICDPAIGSGAFPMGLLKELFACRTAIEGDENGKASEIKKHIIQQNIYGVDIEKGAVDIARLRFWLSLIIDEDTPHALPNMDFKIMQGNSLLEQYNGVDLSDLGYHKTKRENKKGVHFSIFDNEIDVAKRAFSMKMKEYFSCDNYEHKIKLRNEIKDAVQAQLTASHIDIDLNKIGDISANTEFFLWHTWFQDVFDQGGFDIVIGNPPYIDSETMTSTMPETRAIYTSNYSCANGNWDMFVVFIEKAILLCKIKGVYSYIIPNKLIAAKYAEQIRTKLSSHNLIEIRNYSSVPVFTNAAVYPITIVGTIGSTFNSCLFTTMKNKNCIGSQFCVEKQLFNTCKFWDVFFNSIPTINIIRKCLKFETLQHINNIKILGAATVSEAYKIKEVIFDKEECPDSFIFINTGTVDPYQTLWGISHTQYIKGKYLFPRVLFDDLKEININRFKQAKSAKIIVAGMSKRIEAYYDQGNILAGKSTTIILHPEKDILLFLLTILNSKLISYFTSILFNSIKMSGGFMNIGTREISYLPIPFFNEIEKSKLIEISLNIINYKSKNPQADTSALEGEIDNIVYKLYGLTDDEIAIVENS